jgi:hypothetical protein
MHRTSNIEPLHLTWTASLSLHERVLDRIVDVLLDADEVLQMLKRDDAQAVQWIEPHLVKVLDEVNEVMKRLCD